MLIQNTSSAVAASRLTNDSAPIPVPVHVSAPKAGTVAEQQATQPNDPSPSAAQVQSAVDSINKVMLQNNSNIEFSIDKDTKQNMIKVVESSTGEVIRQFPSEEVMSIVREIDRVQQGLLLKQKA